MLFGQCLFILKCVCQRSGARVVRGFPIKSHVPVIPVRQWRESCREMIFSARLIRQTLAALDYLVHQARPATFLQSGSDWPVYCPKMNNTFYSLMLKMQCNSTKGAISSSCTPLTAGRLFQWRLTSLSIGTACFSRLFLLLCFSFYP